MKAKQKLGALSGAIAFVAIWSLSLAGAHSGQLGRVVSESEAAAITGGACQETSPAQCPDPNVAGCSSCTKLVSGKTDYGNASGDCSCVSDCGSYFSSNDDQCASS
jgi:hypothetical protein